MGREGRVIRLFVPLSLASLESLASLVPVPLSLPWERRAPARQVRKERVCTKCNRGNLLRHRNSGKAGALPHESLFSATAEGTVTKVNKTGHGMKRINLGKNVL